MYVQQERIDSFYAQLKEDTEVYTQIILADRKGFEQFVVSAEHPKHHDHSFLEQRPDIDDLSIEFWRETIAKRMDFDVYEFFAESPFYSYLVNRAWLKLAYDITKIICSNYSEYRYTWLKLLFPRLKLGFDLNNFVPHNYLNPVTLRSSIGSGEVNVLLVDRLPKYQTVKEIKFQPASETRTRILREYILSVNESYFYALSSSELYYIYPDAEVELITISPEHTPQFRAELFSLLGINPNLSVAPRSLSQRTFKVAVNKLEKLIVDGGGYPKLDLRDYYLNEEKTHLYTAQDFFRPRELNLNDDSHLNKQIPLYRAYSIYGPYYRDLKNFKDILPHVIYDSPNSYIPRPLSLVEFGMLRFKDSFQPFSDGQESFALARRLLVKSFHFKWERMRINIPRDMFISLLEQFLLYLNNPTVQNSYFKLKHDINHWSKTVKVIDYKSVLSCYKDDLPKFFTPIENERILNRLNDDTAKPVWHLDGIRALYKMYSIIADCINQSGVLSSYNFLDILASIINSEKDRGIYYFVDAVCAQCAMQHRDLFLRLKDVNSICVKQNRNRFLNYRNLYASFNNMKETASAEIKKDLDYLDYYIKRANSKNPIDQKTKNLIKNVFAKYDSEVQDSFFDHTQQLSKKRKSWHDFAKILTGMGYFEDYLELLCPKLITYTDHVTGKRISDFDLRHMVFSSCRRYLININHTRNLFYVTQKAFDCNGPKLRQLNYYEIEQIGRASHIFTPFYEQLIKKGYEESAIPFRTILSLHRLVTRTNFPVINYTSKYQVVLLSTEDSIDKLPSSYLTNAYNYLTGTVLINVKHIVDGFQYHVHLTGDSREVVRGKIGLQEFNKPCYLDREGDALTENVKLEIIHILRQKQVIPKEHSSDDEEVIDREYEFFCSAINNLPDMQKKCLFGTVIYFENKVYYFEDIFNYSRFNIKVANKFYIKMLCDFYPKVDFSNELKREYYKIINLPRPKEPQLMSSHIIDMDKILISMMTYRFRPPESLPTNILSCSLMDIAVVFPWHVTLEKTFMYMKLNYLDLAELDKISDFLYVFFSDYLDLGVNLFFRKKMPKNEGYFIVAWHWCEAVLNGRLFANLPILEVGEVHNIINICKDIAPNFSTKVVTAFAQFDSQKLVQDIASSVSKKAVKACTNADEVKAISNANTFRSTRLAFNVLLIRLLAMMSCDEFIGFFKYIYPNISVESAHKVLKLYVISQHKMYPTESELIIHVKEIFDIELVHSSGSIFLSSRSPGFSPRKIHSQILALQSSLDIYIPEVQTQADNSDDDTHDSTLWF